MSLKLQGVSKMSDASSEVPEVIDGICVICGEIVRTPGRDLCWSCYCDTEGRGDDL